MSVSVSESPIDMELSAWASTYSLLTAERILGRLNIHLDNDKLIAATKDTRNVYFQLLRAPIKNILNGIILEQAVDYQVYAQKLFVDYLLSGESGKEESSPGANTREDLERERLELVEMGEHFDELQLAHKSLIAESQAYLIEMAKIIKKDTSLMVNDELKDELVKDELTIYVEKSDVMGINLRDYRSQFYSSILKVTELLNLLTDYRIDKEQTTENRESLHFDSHIGDS